VERELRNRVRTQLGLEPYDPTSDPKRRAAELGISTEYDLPKPNESNRRRRVGSNIQTLFFRDDMDRKLSGLRDAARSLLQDAGLSALFCAFGFLEYYESENSDEKRIAPLVFYPIELDRELQNGEYRYFISGKNEDVEINVVLRELLKREYSIELPEWGQEEGESNPLGAFLAGVEDIIKARRDWKVRRYVTVGRNCPGRKNPAQSCLVCRGSPDRDLTFLVPNPATSPRTGLLAWGTRPYVYLAFAFHQSGF